MTHHLTRTTFNFKAPALTSQEQQRKDLQRHGASVRTPPSYLGFGRPPQSKAGQE